MSAPPPIPAPAPAPIQVFPSALLHLVLFGAGGHHFALEARRVMALIPAAGSLAGTDMEALLGLDRIPAAPGGRYCLRLRHGEGTAGKTAIFAVDGPVTLATLPAAAISALPPLLAARCQCPAFRALTCNEGTLRILLVPQPHWFAPDQDEHETQSAVMAGGGGAA